jgi:hypothetical protein
MNIVWGNVVRYVDDLGSGTDREDHAFHRADEIILRAEVGQESDDRHNRFHHKDTKSHRVRDILPCDLVSLWLIVK